ncbi:DUF5522 domain-containing protein [Flavobacteriales bacterium]|nr:DUF5522 domain-containing protein [Flavobacteriales bacterium]
MNKQKENKPLPNDDFYISDNGLLIFTKEYHLKRGYCCLNNCKHCPYKNKISER